MAGAYAYTPAIWLPLAAAVFLTVIGLYSWRHRAVPAAIWLAAGSLVGVTMLLGMALESAVIAPVTKIAFHKFNAVLLLPAATTSVCFALESAYPGRWLTRRNLILLWIPPLLVVPAVMLNGAQLMWRTMPINAYGSVQPIYARGSWIGLVYGASLLAAHTAALLWLFARSPQHRWPVALMLCGQVASCGLFLMYLRGGGAHLAAVAAFDPVVAAILALWVTYAIALFGFRIFDPLPAARETVLQQMHAGVVVFDARGRIISLNLAAEKMIGFRTRAARGKTWEQLRLPDLAAAGTGEAGHLILRDAPEGTTQLSEMTLGGLPDARRYAPVLSRLSDFRGLTAGYLLVLQDVTRERRAQAQIVQQQRSLAVLEERGRLARELHDRIGQVLAAAHLQANAARRWLQQGQYVLVDECLAGLADTTLEAEADVRDYLLAAKTAISADRPFFPALREYLLRFSRQYDLPVELTVTPELEAQGLPEAVELQLFRIIQEALSNVRKHARGTCAQVIFSQPGPPAQIVIVDDGCGFDPATIDTSGQTYGLRSMADRAEAVGGSLSVVSSPGQGTRVMVQVPLRRQADENPPS